MRIDAMCRVEGGLGVAIGENVHVGSGSKLNIGGGYLSFGAHSGCSVNVVIATGNPDLSYLTISAAEPPELCHVIKKHTVIGEYVVIFAGAIICPGVKIGDGAIVGAGAMLQMDSAGSVIAMRGDVARAVRVPPADVLIGTCRQIYQNGGSVWIDLTLPPVYHP